MQSLKDRIKNGASGWRLDVVDELPGFFVKELRENVKKADKDAVIIGEVWEDASNSPLTVKDVNISWVRSLTPL